MKNEGKTTPFLALVGLFLVWGFVGWKVLSLLLG